MSTSASCTGNGDYLVVPSVNGSSPLLPKSPQGLGYTPRVRLSDVRSDATPATADLSIVSDLPDPSDVREFRKLTVGAEASYGGYTVKITSICDKEVRFDLLKHP